jgi:hypothetical protein
VTSVHARTDALLDRHTLLPRLPYLFGKLCLSGVAHRLGDANNAVLAAAGYIFRRLLSWLGLLLPLVLYIWAVSDQRAYGPGLGSLGFFTVDLFGRSAVSA